jgi:branched-chain amino acid transport system substrate-binding protein
MRRTTVLIAASLILAGWTAGYAQNLQATTDDGRRVTLMSDGTWQFIEQSSSSQPTDGKEYTKPDKASSVLKFNDEEVSLWYDASVWTPQGAAVPTKRAFLHKDGDVYALVISERIPEPMEKLKQIAIANMEKSDPGAKIVLEENRRVNGQTLLCMKAELTIQAVPWIFYNYYYAGSDGVVQLVTYVPKNLFARYESALTDFLDGIVVSGAATAAPSQIDQLKVAILAPLSGPVPTFGVSTRDGALLAINEWNAKGGVLGKKIAAVVEDSQCTPDPAVKAANKVITQGKVHYIVGEVCSKASIPVSDIANASKVIQISPTSTNRAVTVDKNGATKDYIFRACFIDPFQGTLGALFALKDLKFKNAFLMFDQSNGYAKGLADAFEATFTQMGGKIVGKETYDGEKDKDFSAILTKVKASKADFVYLPDYYNVVNLVTRQAKAKGITAPFIGGDGWDSRDLDAQAADGGYFTNHYDASDPRPEVQNFLKVYGAAYKDEKNNPKVPDALAALAYDATNLLLTAVKIAGADDTDKVKAAMESISFDAVSGNTTFDEQHNPVKGGVMMKIAGGKVVFDSFVVP